VTLLAVEDVSARHGLLQAVRAVSLAVAEGETVALVGANGAGKTTLLRTIAGAHPVSSGRIVLDGVDVARVPAYRRVGLGIALVPEGRKLFADLTVAENLLVAGRRSGPVRSGPVRAGPGRWTVAKVVEAFPLLERLLDHRAGTLSGGEQQATAIGRALMTNPRLLLLDEVSLGLAPVAVDLVYRSLETLLAGGTTAVVVEQDLSRAMRVADRVVCLLEGRVVLEGRAADLSREQVTAAYFGMHRNGSPVPGNGSQLPENGSPLPGNGSGGPA
jgi:branched-chain amino acid transport system ATP-binding protein